MRCLLGAAFLALSFAAPAGAAEGPRVEVLDVSGTIDGAIERAIVSTLRLAAEQGAEAVVVQIDSPGGYDGERSSRIARAVASSAVPVIAWVGPPGARAAHNAVLLLEAADLVAMAPGTSIGPLATVDLRHPDREPLRQDGRILSAADAEEQRKVDVLALQIPDLLRKVDGTEVGGRILRTAPGDVSVRFRKLDLLGRMQHAAAKPSIAYIVLLTGLAGVVFELFHPSRGPAGVSGLVGIAIGVYAVAVLDGSWLALAILVAGIACFCVDLRLDALGVFTLAGTGMLVAGSLRLFPSPLMRVHPWVLAFGILATLAFLLGAMTRVLRDLRAIARGELEVTDPTPHPTDPTPR